jgi:hypothetical protein
VYKTIILAKDLMKHAMISKNVLSLEQSAQVFCFVGAGNDSKENYSFFSVWIGKSY